MALPQEKKRTILEAAMSVFGAAGYKKAYVSDIAAAAGIAKAMVFYYFGSKKALYLYLIEYAGQTMQSEVMSKRDSGGMDFFDRIMDATNLKLAVMKRHPALIAFLNSIYVENDNEVEPEIKSLLSQGEAVRSEIALDGMDRSKFKDGVDPQLVLNILVKFAEGVVGSRLDETRTIDEIMDEFSQCFNLLRNNLYKEEFLK